MLNSKWCWLLWTFVFTLPVTTFLGEVSAQDQTQIPSHVHLVHLDGYHSKVFQVLLNSHRLPHFEFLLKRGKISYQNSTVDKSETMKVIQSYLTSQHETEVVGWWQWNRDSFEFRNFWINPLQVINYALGFEFPKYPTIFDYLVAQGHGVISGFGLHRRSVPFDNYGRAYFEGLKAAKSGHQYFDQIHASVSETLKIYQKYIKDHQDVPKFSMSLLAAADEFAHLQGVTTEKKIQNFCIERSKGEIYHQIIFQILDSEFESQPKIFRRYFNKIKRNSKGIQTVCFDVPAIKIPELGTPADQFFRSVNPNYVLAMMLIDWEVGRLIEVLRAIEFVGHDIVFNERSQPLGIKDYLPSKEQSLFENTLFLFTGDHGMVDSPYKMGDVRTTTPKKSYVLNWIEYLNCRLDLSSPRVSDSSDADEFGSNLSLQRINGDCLQTVEQKDNGALNFTPEALSEATKLGVDFSFLPDELRVPFREKIIPKNISELVTKGDLWARDFISEVKKELIVASYKDYLWLGPLRAMVIKPKIEKIFTRYEPLVLDDLVTIYLKGEPEYTHWEKKIRKSFYNRHVKLVYGGGALNHAEIFIPGTNPTSKDDKWGIRPTYQEIMDYPKSSHDIKLVDMILEHPGVDLVFIREKNEEFNASQELPSAMSIKVLDRHRATGTILVKKDLVSGQLLYSYVVEKGSNDPLQYNLATPYTGTYREWNELSLKSKHLYHNAVAGMGRYLYSKNDAVGDILIQHTPGFNFGDNDGGHGGILRDEKLTIMIASHPNMAQGELWAQQTYCSDQDSVSSCVNQKTHPTVLDLAPTILQFLDPKAKRNALGEFATSPLYSSHLKSWLTNQKVEILTHYEDALLIMQKHADFVRTPLNFNTLHSYLARVLKVFSSDDLLNQVSSLKNVEVEGDMLDLGL